MQRYPTMDMNTLNSSELPVGESQEYWKVRLKGNAWIPRFNLDLQWCLALQPVASHRRLRIARQKVSDTP